MIQVRERPTKNDEDGEYFKQTVTNIKKYQIKKIWL